MTATRRLRDETSSRDERSDWWRDVRAALDRLDAAEVATLESETILLDAIGRDGM